MISSQMSQSHHPTDSQALLQSMLQKLKLQSGRDGHMHLQPPASPTASTLGYDEARGASVLEVDISAVKVFDFNNTPSKELTPPAENLKQQPDLGHEADRSLTSFSSQKVSTDGETGESRMLGPAMQSGFTHKETHPLFPSKANKNGNFSFFKRTNSERGSFSSSAVTNHTPPTANTASSTSPNQNQVQGFTPTWSPPHTAGEEHKAQHVETRGTDSLRQSSDVQIFSSNQTTTNIRKSQRSSENKAKRWTQRIKDRWKEKHSKKGKEDEGTADQRTKQGAQISASDQITTAGKLINTPNNLAGTTIPSWSSCFPNTTLPAQSEDTTDSSRRNSDFDIGLGSFSLLDEILKGQEWGKFINPNHSTPSVNQRPPEEPLSRPKVQPNPYSTNQSPGSLNQLGFGSNQWSFRSTESSAATVFSATPAFPSVHMDISQPKQQLFVHREADQSEPMEDGLNQSDVQRRASGPGPQLRPSSCVEPILYDATLKVRGQTNRKRHHQPAVRRDERQTKKISDGEKAGRGRSISCPFPTSPQMMDDSMESQQDGAPSFSTPMSPPLSPSVFNPSAPTPRGVLKKSPSKDSETLTKRRRVEENRRVTFSEHVLTIEAPSLDLDFTDSEDDSGAEEDSLIDQECEEEQVEEEEVFQARRSNLPAWIQALKRMNAGKKYR